MSHKPRKIMAVEMRALGMTYRKIGENLDVSPTRAQQLVIAGKRVFARRLQAEARAYEERCNDGHFKTYELQMLLPLLGFLKEIADGPTTDSK
jgi:hypothetical protein